MLWCWWIYPSSYFRLFRKRCCFFFNINIIILLETSYFFSIIFSWLPPRFTSFPFFIYIWFWNKILLAGFIVFLQKQFWHNLTCLGSTFLSFIHTFYNLSFSVFTYDNVVGSEGWRYLATHRIVIPANHLLTTTANLASSQQARGV